MLIRYRVRPCIAKICMYYSKTGKNKLPTWSKDDALILRTNLFSTIEPGFNISNFPCVNRQFDRKRRVLKKDDWLVNLVKMLVHFF